jgi:hypothetical protein
MISNRRTFMRKSRALFASVALSAILGIASSAQEQKPASPNPEKAPHSNETQTGRQYSGMYSFLKDGEFVQITVEDQGRVTGFVSRYGDGASDKGAFLDQYFRSGKLEGERLSFTTETVHGVWFDFRGTVERGDGKNTGDEAYYLLKGTLTDNTTDAAKKVTTHSNEVILKKFPAEESRAPSARN